MNLFYQPEIPDILPVNVVLDAEESYHAIRVLRFREGSQIQLTDGQGKLFEGTVLSEDSKACIVSLSAVSKVPKHPFYLHLAVAPTKNIDRFEWFLEKATEIGIDEITPLICEHSERNSLRLDRLQKILVSAMKQSLNLHLPRLNEPVKFTDFLKNDHTGQKFIGYVEEKQDILLKKAYLTGSDALLLIGPEGDFSKKEVSEAIRGGYTAVSLGNSRLRTETAAVVACHSIQILNQ